MSDTPPPPAAPSGAPKMVDYGNVYEAMLDDNRQMRLHIADLARLLAESRQHEDALASRVHELEVQLAEAQKWVPSVEYQTGQYPPLPITESMIAEWNSPEEDAAWAHLSDTPAAQLAAQSEWEPVEDGKIVLCNEVEWDTGFHAQVTIDVSSSGYNMRMEDGGWGAVSAPLGNKYRLCRLRTPAVRDAGTGAEGEATNDRP